MLTAILIDTLVTGLPLVPLVLGVYLVLRIREDFDLTVEGSFALGGATTATAIAAGLPAWLAMVLGVAGGALAGAATALLSLSLRLPVLMAGLVMNMALFSVTLRVLGQPTRGVDPVQTIFPFGAHPGWGADLQTAGVLAVIVTIVLTAFAVFLRTEIGLALRASGVNVRMVRSNGVDDRMLTVLSLVLANALAALGGTLMVQMQGYADVNMGTGLFVAAVGAVLIGVLFVRPSGSQPMRIVLAVVIGALIYRFILVGALRLGLPAGDLKAVTALTLVIAVAAQTYLSPALRRYGIRMGRRRRPRSAAAEPQPEAKEFSRV